MPKYYKKNYLKQVIFRIDFDEITLNKFDEFKATLNKQYDKHEQRREKTGSFTLDMESGSLEDDRTEFDVWSFEDTKRGCKFEASAVHCLLEYSTYKNSEQLRQDVRETMQQLVNKYEIKEVRRIGLRYVNVIQPSGLKKISDWPSYISEYLITYSGFIEKYKKFVRIFSLLELKLDEFNVSLNFGIWNDKYPSMITNSPFILDIDCFTTIPREIEDGNSLDGYVSELNVEAEKIFEDSVTEKLKREMEK